MTPPIKVSGPPSLIAALPYLMGFQPTDSLICVLLQNDALSGCVRYDLSDDSSGLFDLITNTLESHNYDALVFVVITDNLDSDMSWLLAKFRDANIEILDFLITDWRAYRSVLCLDLTCCPPGGTVLSIAERDSIAAELVLEGHVAASSRAELLARLKPMPMDFDQEVAAILDAPKLSGSELVANLTKVNRNSLPVVEIIRNVIALTDPEIRNELEYALLDSVDGQLSNPAQLRIATENLRQCAVYAPRQLAAMPYGLLAFCYWNLGEWILADAALGHASKLDGMNSPARLTKRLIIQGVDPVTARKTIFPNAA